MRYTSLRNKTAALIFFLVLLLNNYGHGQLVKNDNVIQEFWQKNDLANVDLKLFVSPNSEIPLNKYSGEVSFGGGTAFLFSRFEELIVFDNNFLNELIATDDELRSVLMEQLLGDLLVGELHSYPTFKINYSMSTGGGVYVVDNLKLSMDFLFWGNELNSNFSVTIFEEGSTATNTRTVDGNFKQKLRGFNCLLNLTYFINTNKVSPFVSGGIGVGRIKTSDISASISDVNISLTSINRNIVLTTKPEIGFRFTMSSLLYLDLGASWIFHTGKEVEFVHSPRLFASFSVNFGGNKIRSSLKTSHKTSGRYF